MGWGAKGVVGVESDDIRATGATGGRAGDGGGAVAVVGENYAGREAPDLGDGAGDWEAAGRDVKCAGCANGKCCGVRAGDRGGLVNGQREDLAGVRCGAVSAGDCKGVSSAGR